MPTDREILRDLARRYRQAASNPDQTRRRSDWARHNSLKRTRTLIYVRAFAAVEMPACRCVIADPFLQSQESHLRQALFWDTFADDSIFEPWLAIPAVHKCAGWGVDIVRHYSDEPGGAFKGEYPLKRLEDVEKLRMPRHEIDEPASARRVEMMQEIMGDILPVFLDRGPAYQMWAGDLSTQLGFLRGIENVMLDMTDNPEWLHRLVAFLRDGVLKAQSEAEAAGDWGLSDHQNQAMPYAEELPAPAASAYGIQRSRLWGYQASQEMALVSPAQHEEFMLTYQKPILEQFGLSAYGCCEDLTRKIGMLRQIRNLRRIAVSPFANAPRCAEQIGDRYVVSYRPSPADMVGYGFDEKRIRDILRRDFSAFRANGCHADVTLKDVETVQGDTERVRKWVAITRSVAAEVLGG